MGRAHKDGATSCLNKGSHALAEPFIAVIDDFLGSGGEFRTGAHELHEVPIEIGSYIMAHHMFPIMAIAEIAYHAVGLHRIK